AGVTYLRWDGLGSNYYCVDGAAACPGDSFVGSASRGKESDWRFTWALMAGVSYEATKNLSVDVGYRYRRIEGGDTFGWDAAALADGATGSQGYDDGYSQHQVR